MASRALVIGAGGVTGLAWSCATLVALERATGWDPRTADVLLGTSQGSLLAALLACGVSTPELLAWYRKELPAEHPLRHRSERRSVRAPRGLPIPAAPGLLLRAALRPREVSPATALAGLLPAGRSTLDGFLAPLEALATPGEWVDHPATWAVAVDLDSGRRVAFGRDGAPHAGILEAVRASCSVPGNFAPPRIAGRRYVDGAVHSTTSADLLLDAVPDEVIVLAPMAGGDRRTRLSARALVGAQLAREVIALRDAGAKVRTLAPTEDDLTAMSGSALDGKRRFAIFEAALASAPDRLEAAALR